jgi:hypothetical protein
MIIGYDIYDRFTMEHFPLRQSMVLRNSFFLLATEDASRFLILEHLILKFQNLKSRF